MRHMQVQADSHTCPPASVSAFLSRPPTPCGLDDERGVYAGGDMYSMLKRAPELLAWNKLGKRIALDVALGLNYLHSR